MNYIGSKYSLLDEISGSLESFGVPPTGVAFDAFAGTGVVSQFLKSRGHVVYANDWQHYSYVTNRAFLLLDELPGFRKLLGHDRWGIVIGETADHAVPLFSISRQGQERSGDFAQVIAYLDQLPGRKGDFYEAYCEGGEAGRTYYSCENGLRIQAVRDCIEQWLYEGLIDDLEHSWLVASLVESADRVANTASVYAAFLKHIKKSAHKPLRLLALEPIRPPYPAVGHQVFRGDVLDVLANHSNSDQVLTYVDPPYNHRQYASYYHILETISRWDLGAFEPRLKTGLRGKTENLSPFCSKRGAYQAFDKLLNLVKSNVLLFSYNNEGVLGEAELIGLIEAHFGTVDVRKVAYQRFRADNDSKNRRYKANSTQEFLILASGKRKLPQQRIAVADVIGRGNKNPIGKGKKTTQQKGLGDEYPYYKVQVFHEHYLAWKDEKSQHGSIAEATESMRSKRLANKQTRILVVEGLDKRRELDGST
jgi:adenine-specific DNA-methyltransferase